MPINPEGAFSVPLELFGGLNKDVSPIDLPEGLSPSCQDVVFLPGQVQTRPGLGKLYVQANPPAAPINHLGTFSRYNGRPLNIVMDGQGNLYFEDVAGAPGVLFSNLIGTVGAGQIVKADNGFNRYWMAFSDGLKGVDIPRYYDASGNFSRVSQSGPAGAVTAAADVTVGTLVAGVHKVCVSFLLSSGFITKPSPVASWTALGTDSVAISNLPTGTVFAVTGSQAGETVVGRILHFTGAGGAAFYYIALPVSSGGTMVLDNTTTSVTLTFSDVSLFAGVPIGVQGNNLFNLDTLSPCLGIKFYKSRLTAWGVLNKLPNLLNMDFDGGVTGGGPFNPLGWTRDATPGGTVVKSPLWQGGWQVTGSGLGVIVGRISQTFYQDSLGVAIARPNTFYSVRLWVQPTGVIAGALVFSITSASTGFVSSGQINATLAGLVSADLTSAMPASIPSDLTFSLCGLGIDNTKTVVLDELSIYPTLQPVLTNQISVSYVNNPESFDLVTGLVAAEYPEEQILDLWEQRDVLYLGKSDLTNETGSLHSTQDNGTTEPSGWTVVQISKAIGLISARGTDLGEDYAFLADIGGLYMFNGGEPLKVSQEIQAIWDGINPAAYQTIWMKNDRVARRLYIGLPMGTSSSPNVLAVMDYREMKGFSEIAYGDPVHISYAGRVLSTDLSRKWTLWNVPANCGAILQRGSNRRTMVFGGAGGTGFSAGGFRNAYSLNPAQFHDDDYGPIRSSYVTYFLMTPQMNQMAQMLGLNLYTYLRMKMSGSGLVQLTFYGNDLSNAFPLPPAFPLSSVSIQDAELGLNVTTERMAVGISVWPQTPNNLLPVASLNLPDVNGNVFTITVTDGGILQHSASSGAAQTIYLSDSLVPNTAWKLELNGSTPDVLAPVSVPWQPYYPSLIPMLSTPSSLVVSVEIKNGILQQISPLAGAQADAAFTLQKLVVSGQKHAWAPVRGVW